MAVDRWWRRLFLWGLVAPFDAAAACDRVVPTHAFESLLTTAELAWGTSVFEGATDAVRATVPCLGGVPTPEVAARLHRLEGLRRSLDGAESADRAFAAARALDPNHGLPETVPADHPAWAAWTAVDLATGGLQTLAAPAEGWLRVDGIDTLERPDAWPSLVQWVDLQERPRWSVVQWPGDPLPAYPLLGTAPTLPPAPVTRSGSRHRGPLAVATGAAAALTLSAWGMSAIHRSAFVDLDTPDDRLDGHQRGANTWATTGVVAGLGAAGVGAALVATW